MNSGNRVEIIIALLLGFTLAAQAGAGTTKDQSNACANGSGVSAINACTLVIRSGRRPQPDVEWAFVYRGEAYDNVGQYARAIQDFNEAILLKPQDAEAFNGRGAAHDELGQYSLAIQDYSEAIRLKPDYARAFNNRGKAYNDFGQYARALRDLGVAIQLKPDYAVAFLNRGNAYFGLGQYARAIRDYDEA